MHKHGRQARNVVSTTTTTTVTAGQYLRPRGDKVKKCMTTVMTMSVAAAKAAIQLHILEKLLVRRLPLREME